MSRQSVIQELQKPDSYLFRTSRQKLIEGGIKENDPLVATLDILISQTFSTFSQKKLSLESKYMKKLKTLSILSCFYGKQTISLPQLEKQLGCNRQECLNLLVQASIYKLVGIKIDEASDRIIIQKCKIREREVKQDIEKQLRGKFKFVAEKNADIEQSLKHILKEIGAFPKQQEEDMGKVDLTSYLRRKQQDAFRL